MSDSPILEVPEPQPAEVIPSQLVFPARAVIRTILQWLLGAAFAWMARVWGLDLTPYSSQIIDAATAFIALVFAAFFAWLMTRPKIAALLHGTFLAPTPKG